MIYGVAFKTLTRHADERGFFEEVIRHTDDFFHEGFGQLSYSLVYPGVTKAWHLHKRQTQWTCILGGAAKVVLHDCRSDSETFRTTMELLVGDHLSNIVYKFPPGVAHGYRCLHGPMTVLYVTSGVYDGADEERIAHDDPTIGYNWKEESRIR